MYARTKNAQNITTFLAVDGSSLVHNEILAESFAVGKEFPEADELTEWQMFDFAEEEFGPVCPAGGKEDGSIRWEQV